MDSPICTWSLAAPPTWFGKWCITYVAWHTVLGWLSATACFLSIRATLDQLLVMMAKWRKLHWFCSEKPGSRNRPSYQDGNDHERLSDPIYKSLRSAHHTSWQQWRPPNVSCFFRCFFRSPSWDVSLYCRIHPRKQLYSEVAGMRTMILRKATSLPREWQMMLTSDIMLLAKFIRGFCAGKTLRTALLRILGT